MPALASLDLHSHTTFSDGNHSPMEMAQEAVAKGMTLGISDHVDSERFMKGDEQVLDYLEQINNLPVWRSVEVSVEPKLQVSTELLSRFDYVIMAVHHVDGQWIFKPDFAYRSIDDLLGRWIDHVARFLSLYPFHILAHPTLLPKPIKADAPRHWSEKWMTALIEVCVENHVALEFNVRSMTPHPEFVALALEKGATFSIGSDAHRKQSLGKMSFPHGLIEQFNIPEERFFIPVRKDIV